MKIEVECVTADAVCVNIQSEHALLSVMLKAERARRLAAELIVAAERAERLESDQRAPG